MLGALSQCAGCTPGCSAAGNSYCLGMHYIHEINIVQSNVELMLRNHEIILFMTVSTSIAVATAWHTRRSCTGVEYRT
jgi:hypothetical protein